MQRTDIACGLGNGYSYVKFTLTFTDLQALSGSGAKTITLLADPGGNAVNPAAFQIPQGGFVLFSRVNVTTAFAGGSLSALTMSIGRSGGTTAISAARDVFTAAATFDKTGVNAEANVNTAYNVIVTVTPTGDSCSAATAGVVDIYLGYVDITTPSA